MNIDVSKTYIIPGQTVVALMNYLLGRPMAEVEQGVYALRNLQQHELPPNPVPLSNE